MSGQFDFIRDIPDCTFYDNIISILGINQFIEYVNISYKQFEEIRQFKETTDFDFLNINLDYDFDYEDKYII